MTEGLAPCLTLLKGAEHPEGTWSGPGSSSHRNGLVFWTLSTTTCFFPRFSISASLSSFFWITGSSSVMVL